MKPLSGREASILALLAQSKSLSEFDKIKILATLEGNALKIAQNIIGESNDEEFIKIAAKGFIEWANELSINDFK